jgi:hypothetical protein
MVIVIGVLGFLMVRQLRSYSLRTKLIIAVTTIVLVSVSVITFLNSRNTRTALIAAADEKLLGAASQTATRVDDLITFNLNIIRTEAETTKELTEFLSLHASGQSTNEEAAKIITILQSFSQRDPENITSYALLDSQGVDVADTFTEMSHRQVESRIFPNADANGSTPPFHRLYSRQRDKEKLFCTSPVPYVMPPGKLSVSCALVITPASCRSCSSRRRDRPGKDPFQLCWMKIISVWHTAPPRT